MLYLLIGWEGRTSCGWEAGCQVGRHAWPVGGGHADPGTTTGSERLGRGGHPRGGPYTALHVTARQGLVGHNHRGLVSCCGRSRPGQWGSRMGRWSLRELGLNTALDDAPSSWKRVQGLNIHINVWISNKERNLFIYVFRCLYEKGCNCKDVWNTLHFDKIYPGALRITEFRPTKYLRSEKSTLLQMYSQFLMNGSRFGKYKYFVWSCM